MTQPTHPAFYEHDERQYTCTVCKTEFCIPPPSREELMAGFTGIFRHLMHKKVYAPLILMVFMNWAIFAYVGPELAALLQVGCLIVAEKKTSDMVFIFSKICGLCLKDAD